MAGVLEEISQWASKLPYWEQAALEKVVAGTALAEDDFAELLRYLLEDAGLADGAPKPRPTLTFPQLAATGIPAAGAACRLSKITKLQNVNALVPNQELAFGPDLTIVFGGNGAGKSGYARVIASAAFTRGDRQVLRDIAQPVDEAAVISAEIELTDGSATRTLSYTVGQSCPEMRCFYVFDSTSVRAHLTHSNPMSFSPGGLGYLTQLALVTDQVRRRLQSLVAERTRENPFAPLFPEDTTVRQRILALDAKTDLKALRELSKLSADDEAAIQQLDRQIARLKIEEIPEKIANMDLVIDDLRALSERLVAIERELADEQLAEIPGRLEEWQTRSELARSLSAEGFAAEGLEQTGSPVWTRFIEAARALAQAESAVGRPYPIAGKPCLLCHQPLSRDAAELIRRFWKFLEGDAQTQLAETQQALLGHRVALGRLDLAFFDEQAVSYRHLKEHDPTVLEEVEVFLDACRRRRSAALAWIDFRRYTPLQPLPLGPQASIAHVIQTLQLQKQNLEKRDVAQEIERLQARLTLLLHRQRLGEQLGEIEKYVADCVWASRASAPKVKRSTAHITLKYDGLFDKLVTKQYLKLFQQLLEELNCPRRVKVQTRPEKGTVRKQIALDAHETVDAGQAQPEKVLSEGEQRAVALADFLTEVALDEGSSSVILDDPVSSLDFEWKETIARHLVREARRRQVVVFTHDLHFLHCLKTQADQQGVPVVGHWIEKRDGRPGRVFLDNSPMCEHDYRNTTRARKCHEQATQSTITPEQRQLLLDNGFGALRSCYEAFVIYDLFGSVVLRFGERVSIDRLKDVAIDLSIRDQVIEKVGLLSRYIGAHLHSDPYAAQKPTPEVLLREIEEFEALRKRQREYIRSVAAARAGRAGEGS